MAHSVHPHDVEMAVQHQGLCARACSAAARDDIEPSCNDFLRRHVESPTGKQIDQKKSGLMLTGSTRHQRWIPGIDSYERGRKLGRIHLRLVVAFLVTVLATGFFAAT